MLIYFHYVMGAIIVIVYVVLVHVIRVINTYLSIFGVRAQYRNG